MRANGLYKKILSALMLVLYGFIITPVVLWHSHACGQSEVCKAPSGNNDFPSDTDDSCAICKHVYASHVAGEDVRIEVSTVAFRLYRASFTQHIPYIFTGHSNTRGSPAVAADFPSFV